MGALLPQIWEPVVTTVASSVFGLTVDAAFNGSGDRAFHWVQLFVTVVASAAVTLIWSIADRKAVSYPRLYPWFRVYVRFGLAAAMIGYGAFKIIPSQFSAPILERLLQPFGDASPMGLLWTFMGASAAYTIFTGVGELVGGLLLTMRRTALLGALVTAGVMTHVVVLNFTYDVPVKIYSTVLLLAALVIAAPDARRLFDFFLRHPDKPLFQRRALRIAAVVVALLFVATSLVMSLKQSYEQRQRALTTRHAGSSPIFGIWNVDELTVDGVAHPPLTTDLTRWRRFVVSGKEIGTMYNMDDTRARYVMAFDEAKRTLTLTKRADPAFKAVFNVQRPGSNTMLLDG
ncbi:MAG TPA: hypothetical protein VEU30_07020, partial [Thermoanaerobaculia bacterium]|nr:hypothetical protein [Thermoanaerobaculia bacterium]